MTASNRNESEHLFEEYLTAHGHTEWTHEVPVEGKRKNPDYRLEYGGSSYFFEIKEFDAPPAMLGSGMYDPYGPIRRKIVKAAEKFKEYREFSCSLVLANPKEAFVSLGDSWAIIGAMLGNLGFTFAIGDKALQDRSTENVFLGGGKMVNYKRQEPQNTTISSVIVLGTYPLRQKRINIAVKDRQEELGRNLTDEETWAFYEAIPEGPELRRVRVVVYENPFARLPLTRDLFSGPFDEEWSDEDGYMRRVYVGSEVAAIESVLGEG